MKTSRIGSAFVALLLVATGCRAEPTDLPNGPNLEEVRTVVLQEPDSFLIARPSGLSVSSGGLGFLVSDVASGRVLQWDTGGKPVRSWGRVGRGPGEFSGPAAVVRQGSKIWVADYGSQSWKALDTASGRQLEAISFSGVLSYVVPSDFGDSLWFGLRNETDHTALAVLVPGSDSAVRFLALPTAYDSLRDIGIGRLSPIIPARSGTSWIVGFGPLSGLYELDASRTVTDSFVLPTLRRRGASVAAIQRAEGRYAPLMNSMSVLTHLAPSAAEGRFVAVHYDPIVADEDSPLVQANLFVSVIDATGRVACVDREVPRTGAGRPVVQVLGDSLYVLYQELDGKAVSTRIDKYLIDTSGCDWLPLLRGPMIANK